MNLESERLQCFENDFQWYQTWTTFLGTEVQNVNLKIGAVPDNSRLLILWTSLILSTIGSFQLDHGRHIKSLHLMSRLQQCAEAHAYLISSLNALLLLDTRDFCIIASKRSDFAWIQCMKLFLKWRPHRCWWRTLERKCVDDNFDMLVRVLAVFVTHIINFFTRASKRCYLYLISVTNTKKWSPT